MSFGHIQGDDGVGFASLHVFDRDFDSMLTGGHLGFGEIDAVFSDGAGHPGGQVNGIGLHVGELDGGGINFFSAPAFELNFEIKGGFDFSRGWIG